MKILIATDCYIFQTGGVTSVVLSLEKGLREKGHEVKVLALSNSHRSYREGESYFIRSYRFYDYPEHRRSLALRDPLLEELKAWKPDVIHIHTEASAGRLAKIIGRQTDTPFVMTTHTYFEYFIFGRFRDSRPVRILAGLWGRKAYRQAERVIVPAEKARAFPHLQPVADRVTVIPNGIRPELFRIPVSPEEKSALFGRYGLFDNGRTLVMVTRLSREKNVAEILRYFPALLRAMPGAQLVIVGDGPGRKRLEALCADSGIGGSVRFTGRIPPDEVRRYYAMGDLFVSASTFELHSISYLEALAAGLPLVCREDPSLQGVLDDGENGIIYRDERGFVDAVTRILGDVALRARMREKAMLRADETSEQRFTERTLGLYEEVCREWASGASRRGKKAGSGQ